MQFGHPREVAKTSCLFDSNFGLFQLGFNSLRTGERCFFRFPLFFQHRILAFFVRQLFIKHIETLQARFIRLFLQRLLFQLQLDDTAIETVQLFRLRVDLHTDAGCCFIDKVDGFIRQLTVGNIAMRQGRRRHDGRVSDLHVVVQFITFFQTAQYGDGIFYRRLGNEHFLETTFQSGVFFNVLAVFIKGGGADAVQFTARQGRFQHVAGIHRAVGFTRADHGVQLIDKQDNVAFLFRQIVQHTFQTLFEFTAIFRPGHQRAHIQRQYPTAFQPFWYFAVDDTLRQSFDDCRFTHPGFTNQHRVVFSTALKYLDGTTDLFITADHRVQFALFGTLGQIDGKFFQCLTLVFGTLIVHAFTSAHLFNRLSHIGGCCSGRFQQVGQRTA